MHQMHVCVCFSPHNAEIVACALLLLKVRPVSDCYFSSNIQATISINPKSVISAISPVQKSEIECKMVKLKMIDSSDKIDLGQTKWRAKIRRRLKLFT